MDFETKTMPSQGIDPIIFSFIFPIKDQCYYYKIKPISISFPEI